MWRHLIKGVTQLEYTASRLPALAKASYKYLGPNLTNSLVEKTIYDIYCGSNNLNKLSNQIVNLRERGAQTILHLASENPQLLSVEKYHQTIFQIVDVLQPDDIVAVKLTSLVDRQVLVDNNENLLSTVLPLLLPIVVSCMERGVLVTIDAEETILEQAIRKVAQTLMQQFNKDEARVYVTYQCYLQDTLTKIEFDLETAKREGYVLGAKLVRGAYWEWETGQPDPKVWKEIELTHQCYNKAAELLIMAKCPLILATHNPDSVDYLEGCMNRMGDGSWGADSGVVRPRFAQLLGLNDKLTDRLIQSRQQVYKFVPFGPTEVVFPYLVRRLEENADLFKYT